MIIMGGFLKGKAVLFAVMGVAFIVAGLIEGFVTPSQEISEPAKLAIGILAAAAFWAYWLLGGRLQQPLENAAAKAATADAASAPGNA